MDNKANYKVINFSRNNDIPVYVEVSNGYNPYILYGADNHYPDYLIELQNRSPKHSAIVKGKAAIVGGNGFSKNNIADKTKLFLKNANGTDNLDEILAKVSYDLEMFGAYALIVDWSRTRETIARITYVDAAKVRIATVDCKEGEGYWVCDDWYNTKKHRPLFYPKFDKVKRNAPSTVLYVKEYRPGNEWYGQPEYVSSLDWINLEGKIPSYHNANIDNGFHPSMIINYNSGIPTEDEMAYAVKNLKKQYEGAMAAGKVIVTFSEDKDTAPVITPIELNNSDERFIDLNKEIENGIYQGHRVTNPALFGVKTPGELGNTNDLASDLKVFNAMYARPKQNAIESVFQMLAEVNGISDKLVINEFKLDIPVALSVSDILSILSSPLSNEAKSALLKGFGYTDETINQLLTQGN